MKRALVASLLWLGLSAAQRAPQQAIQQVAPALAAPPAAVAVTPCTPVAVRLAYDRHVAPALKGCLYAQVASALNELFGPVPAEAAPDAMQAGRIFYQSVDPETPIAGRGAFSVRVSTGPARTPTPAPTVSAIPSVTADASPAPRPTGTTDSSGESGGGFSDWILPIVGIAALAVLFLLWRVLRGLEPKLERDAPAFAALLPRFRSEIEPGGASLKEESPPLIEEPHLALSVGLDGTTEADDFAIEERLE